MLGERRETNEVGKQDAHLLRAFACRWEIELMKALLAPLVASREQDDHVGGDDQRVPFPPAGMPGSLADQSGADSASPMSTKQAMTLAGSNVMFPRNAIR